MASSRKIDYGNKTFKTKTLKCLFVQLITDPRITSSLILEHHLVLEDKLQQYFASLSVNKYNWVLNPFAGNAEETKRI